MEREAKEGDTAVIDFEGFLDGKPFEGGKGENHSLELGSGSFVPGFEEQLIGMKAGDEKDIDITFPEDYHADLAGKAVVFKVKVHEVKEKEVPALDDEFAKDVSEFDTLKDLKADLKKKITEERQKAADRAFEDNLMEQVADNITADVPDAMVDNQAHQFLDNFKTADQPVRASPMTSIMKMTGMDEAKLLEDAKEPALRQVRLDLATGCHHQGREHRGHPMRTLRPSIKKMAEQYGMDAGDREEVSLQAEQVKDQLLTQKAVAVVVDSATAEKPERRPPRRRQKTLPRVRKKPAKKTAQKTEAAKTGREACQEDAAKKTAKKDAE